jgi:hypothetical protein
MKLDECAIVLRPRSVAEVMDLACRVCAVNAGIYLRVAAVAILPCFAVCVALRYWLSWDWGWVWTAAAGLATIAQGAFTVLAGKLIFSEKLTVREVLAGFARRLPSYLGALLVTRAVMAISAFTFFIALPLLWVYMLFAHEASLLEGAGPIETARRSTRFIKGRGGVAFQLLLLLLVAEVSAIACVEVLGDGIVNDVLQLGQPFGSLLEEGGTPFALLGYFLSVPYVATARFLQYIDVRTRADGWDVQVRFIAIVAKDSAAQGRAAA